MITYFPTHYDAIIWFLIKDCRKLLKKYFVSLKVKVCKVV